MSIPLKEGLRHTNKKMFLGVNLFQVEMSFPLKEGLRQDIRKKSLVLPLIE